VVPLLPSLTHFAILINAFPRIQKVEFYGGCLQNKNLTSAWNVPFCSPIAMTGQQWLPFATKLQQGQPD
jgi:hypothetical protein